MGEEVWVLRGVGKRKTGDISPAGGGGAERRGWTWWTKKSPPAVSEKASMNMAATYSPGTKSSTIGHEGLNFSVRNGKR